MFHLLAWLGGGRLELFVWVCHIWYALYESASSGLFLTFVLWRTHDELARLASHRYAFGKTLAQSGWTQLPRKPFDMISSPVI